MSAHQLMCWPGPPVRFLAENTIYRSLEDIFNNDLKRWLCAIKLPQWPNRTGADYLNWSAGLWHKLTCEILSNKFEKVKRKRVRMMLEPGWHQTHTTAGELAADRSPAPKWRTHKNHLHHIHTGFKSDFIISKGFSCRFNTVVVVFECSIERKGLIEIPSHSLWKSMSNEQRTFDELDEKIVKLRKTWDWGRVDLNSKDSPPEAFQWDSEKKASISFHVRWASRSPWPASI